MEPASTSALTLLSVVNKALFTDSHDELHAMLADESIDVNQVVDAAGNSILTWAALVYEVKQDGRKFEADQAAARLELDRVFNCIKVLLTCPRIDVNRPIDGNTNKPFALFLRAALRQSNRLMDFMPIIVKHPRYDINETDEHGTTMFRSMLTMRPAAAELMLNCPKLDVSIRSDWHLNGNLFAEAVRARNMKLTEGLFNLLPNVDSYLNECDYYKLPLANNEWRYKCLGGIIAALSFECNETHEDLLDEFLPLAKIILQREELRFDIGTKIDVKESCSDRFVRILLKPEKIDIHRLNMLPSDDD